MTETKPPSFLRTLDMPERFSHKVFYYAKPDGELDCVIHQERPFRRDFWSIESHLESFVVFNPETDVERCRDCGLDEDDAGPVCKGAVKIRPQAAIGQREERT
ncbi:hypothetical protein BF49_5592 [Bradyrhizobium sp.]|uniref:hypothetical protein n=1 Tax=Bradyrhizobium sp. TaxID=376 RepID=UPI0007C1D40E|nr:hypothetical protein [Bradyrhizobium sp.]CUT14512.1 hypothetical protein BF49_5592 [Bradyrhizobium sp.]